MTAIPTRPPFPPSDGIQLAVIYFLIVVGMLDLMLPFTLAFAVMDGEWNVLPRLTILYVAVGFLGVLAIALARRKPWSRIPAIAATALMTAGAAFGAIYSVLYSDEHGSAYVLMGGVMWFAFGIVVLTQLLRTAGPETFRPRPSGWMDDPAHEARLRYWDGERWTLHVAP